MIWRMILLCLLLAGCGGGGGGGDPVAAKRLPFAWWNGPAGALSVNARAQGPGSIIIAWPQIWHGGMLYPDWNDRLNRLVAANPTASGFYLIDEPAGKVPPVSDAELDTVAAAFPAGKTLMMSLSYPELDKGQHIPPQANLIGANLYAFFKLTDPIRYLDKLAAYGKPMYLNLDAAAAPYDDCTAVPDAAQQASIDLDNAMISWGRERDIRAYVAFVWQGDPAQRLCGASTMPLVRNYMAQLGG